MLLFCYSEDMIEGKSTLYIAINFSIFGFFVVHGVFFFTPFCLVKGIHMLCFKLRNSSILKARTLKLGQYFPAMPTKDFLSLKKGKHKSACILFGFRQLHLSLGKKRVI